MICVLLFTTCDVMVPADTPNVGIPPTQVVFVPVNTIVFPTDPVSITPEGVATKEASPTAKMADWPPPETVISPAASGDVKVICAVVALVTDCAVIVPPDTLKLVVPLIQLVLVPAKLIMLFAVFGKTTAVGVAVIDESATLKFAVNVSHSTVITPALAGALYVNVALVPELITVFTIVPSETVKVVAPFHEVLTPFMLIVFKTVFVPTARVGVAVILSTADSVVVKVVD